MDKFVVVIFPDEARAYDGVRRLKRLHADGAVSLFGCTVIKKEVSGGVTVLQPRDDQFPVGIAVGSLAGVLIGVLGGPVGAAVGLSVGSMLGLVHDAREIDVSEEFLSKVAQELSGGRFAVVAELAETWVTPLDVEMDAAGGIVIREIRIAFEEAEAEREAAARRAELQRLKDEWRNASAERRAKLGKQIDRARADLEDTVARLEARAKQVNDELVRKIDTLDRQLADAAEDAKSDIERRVAELRQELATRSAKLKQAVALAREALAPMPAPSEAPVAAH